MEKLQRENAALARDVLHMREQIHTKDAEKAVSKKCYISRSMV